MRHRIRRGYVGQQSPHSLGLAALLVLSTAGTVRAQAPIIPPPEVRQQGEQQERLQREREEAQRGLLQPAPKATEPAPPEPIQPWPESESPCLPIREITLVGDSSASFQWALDGLISGTDPAVGRCLGIEGVNIAASRAQQALTQRGYVTSRIVVQQQALTKVHGRGGEW